MANNIVTVNVTQTVAPTPNQLQKTGAFISQGATNTAVYTASLLTQLSDLTPLLVGTKTISTISWSSNVATVTAAAPHGYTIGDIIPLTLVGNTPSAYNGVFFCTVTTTTAFTFALAYNPGSLTVPGSFTPEDVAELVAMATTFFAQGSNTAVYVLELGISDATEGPPLLTTFITANPNAFYAYLVPRLWSSEAGFVTMLNNFTSTTAKTYWHVTVYLNNYTNFGPTLKDALLMAEAPGIPATEFSAAARFYVTLNWSPSSTNKVTPLQYAYLVGVTPYPTKGNAAQIALLRAANVDYISTGAEGGISNTILALGTCADSNSFNYWYSVDWAQINVDQAISNEIINGSNNPAAPLYYNQAGINRLQARGQATLTQGISYGLVLAPATVSAVPFSAWVAANPSSYKIGQYGGLSVTMVPARGFSTITFNLQVSNFPLA